MTLTRMEFEPEHVQDGEQLFEADGRLAVLELVEEGRSDSGQVTKLDLTQAESAAPAADRAAQGADR